MSVCCKQVQQMCCAVLWACAASLSAGTHLYICLCDAKPLQGWFCFLKHALQETHGKAESGDEAMGLYDAWVQSVATRTLQTDSLVPLHAPHDCGVAAGV
jgi:hypothetical protein